MSYTYVCRARHAAPINILNVGHVCSHRHVQFVLQTHKVYTVEECAASNNVYVY